MKVSYIDCETTGLDARSDEITELAAVIEVGGEIVDQVEILMRPTDPSRVPQEVLDLTGRTREELAAYPGRREGYQRLLAFLGKHVDKYDRADKLVWAGQNAPFDMAFTRAFFSKMGDKYFGSWWQPHPADLISLAVAARMAGKLEVQNFKLATIAEAVGVGFRAHRAIDDVLATRATFKRVLDRLTGEAVPEGAQGA